MGNHDRFTSVYTACFHYYCIFLFYFFVSAYKWFWMCAQLPVKIFITIILNGTHQLLFTLNRCMCLKPFWPLVLSELYIFFKVRVIFFGKKCFCKLIYLIFLLRARILIYLLHLILPDYLLFSVKYVFKSWNTSHLYSTYTWNKTF